MSRKEEPAEPVPVDHDELYDRLSRTCIIESTVIDDDPRLSDTQAGLRKRH